MSKSIQRSQIGKLSKISQGGQGVVFHAPSVRSRYAASMVYKEYKPNALADCDGAALSAMPSFLESLPYVDGARLISLSAWPCVVVESQGLTIGFVMPAVPDDFFTDILTVRGSSKIIAEFQHLLNPEHVLARRGIELTDEQRYALLHELVSALTFLHQIEVCVGDISPKNLLFSLSPEPAVYFIDCDAMRVAQRSVHPQLETPGWEVPTKREELGTPQSDIFKLGLLALRLLAGDQDTRDPRHLPESTPALLRQAIVETVSRPAGKRPPLSAWTYALARAIEDARNRPSTPRGTPAPTKAHSTAASTQPVATAAAAGPPPPLQPPNTYPIWTPPPSPGQSSPAKWIAIAAAVLIGIFVLSRVAQAGNKPTHSTYRPSTSSGYSSPTTGFGIEPTSTWSLPTLTTTKTASRWYWDGMWMRSYWEAANDCDPGIKMEYLVVQPSDQRGMYELKSGCFPERVVDALNARCQSYDGWLKAGTCAVYDPEEIMSQFELQGDLQVVSLSNDCLVEVGQTKYDQGTIHQYCVTWP
ncbi:protein kinase family protein [Mycobacteroides abscessus]|uniref:hypothetical protein n=1 Tax=Mycobacteroides abscessus TaxID=36809 RepID=UPI00092C139D|nr:hypothetical protein [Mycobacteroides abscessus]SHP56078.1 Mn2+-dependent serine/threonine protein kinase [Mycobacteroides abscessus subsp. bolletii]SHS27765.1 Mn2+-dependent serine/threonine protein kinase [Mycobacteroides abscessus subsp. bolletii]SHS78175.1 Mn2+-dependent serine/threonine protein kinase [Mycobacteroides abscessus subsp. bolletii]SKF64889.1 Mn2+-dependent serine/threonine protein kinase [Mycobacteroides abscessus subsp. bolletii]SKG37414.1 Mn2+-dependent serine/threonine 